MDRQLLRSLNPRRVRDWPVAPAIIGGSTAGANTYTSQIGHYQILDGGLVWVSCQIQINVKDGTMAGDVTITNFPTVSDIVLNQIFATHFGAVNLSAGYTGSVVRLPPASTAAVLVENGDNVAAQTLQAAAIANGSIIFFQGVYQSG
jgi:hypothetical protein